MGAASVSCGWLGSSAACTSFAADDDYSVILVVLYLLGRT
jgi:hypothetical protein